MNQTTTSAPPRPQGWKPDSLDTDTDRRFASDDVLNAYLKGKQAGRAFEAQAFLEKFARNFETAANIYVQMFERVRAAGIESVEARLRVDGPARFTGMFIVPAKDYFSERFDAVYEESIQLKRDAASDVSPEIAIVFTQQEGLEPQLYMADGFAFHYDPEA